MASPFPAAQLKNLKIFIDLCKSDPAVVHHPDLHFFKEYIESLGGTIPVPKPKPEQGDSQPETPTKERVPTPDPEESEESAESDVEIDNEGCIEPDVDAPQPMGDKDKEASEEDIDKSNERKVQAIEYFADGKYDDAIKAYTVAILLNPGSALLYAKRGQCYLQTQKPNACIRDCNRALEINPDSAPAYKYRGRAHRLLGHWLQAAEDLRVACKLDYDEQADEWLKEVTPNASKLEQHQRKQERKRLEKEVKATRERVKRMREQHEKYKKAQEKANEEEGDVGMGDFLNIMNDPEVMEAFQDPEVAAAFQDISTNPANILKYQSNPKVSAVLKKLATKFSGQMPGAGGFPGFSGFGGADGFPGAGRPGANPPPPKSTDDVDLD